MKYKEKTSVKIIYHILHIWYIQMIYYVYSDLQENFATLQRNHYLIKDCRVRIFYLGIFFMTKGSNFIRLRHALNFPYHLDFFFVMFCSKLFKPPQKTTSKWLTLNLFQSKSQYKPVVNKLTEIMSHSSGLTQCC